MWVAVASFLGAILGSLIVEWYRQRNRLQLAAIDKRLEAYQEAYRRTLKIIDYVQEHKAYPERPLFDDDEFRALENEAKEWLEGHYLYLGNEVGGKVAMAIGTLDEEHLQAARRAIEKESGLPRWRWIMPKKYFQAVRCQIRKGR